MELTTGWEESGVKDTVQPTTKTEAEGRKRLKK